MPIQELCSVSDVETRGGMTWLPGELLLLYGEKAKKEAFLPMLTVHSLSFSRLTAFYRAARCL